MSIKDWIAYFFGPQPDKRVEREAQQRLEHWYPFAPARPVQGYSTSSGCVPPGCPLCGGELQLADYSRGSAIEQWMVCEDCGKHVRPEQVGVSPYSATVAGRVTLTTIRT